MSGGYSLTEEERDDAIRSAQRLLAQLQERRKKREQGATSRPVYVRLSRAHHGLGSVKTTKEVAPGVLIDFDKHGVAIGVEVIDAFGVRLNGVDR